MAESIMKILFRPDEFFEEHAGKEPALGLPFGIVLIYAALSAILGYQMTVLMAPMYASIAEGYEGIIIFFGAAGGFVSAIIFWIIASVIFYLLSMIFKGEGSMKKVLEAVGYGIAPLIASVGIAIIWLSMIADQIITPVIRDFMDPAAVDTALEAFMAQPAMAEYTLLQTVLSIVFMIWAANIWYSGMRYARKLTARDAAYTVFIPVGLYLIITIISVGVL
ncbi:hypothetical protein RJ53_05995 [Methanocalculus chunghsingensis]|uniref:Yip1 domain-containing protein n=1 Tax=Methanocalculus chunghsingensis TaxID=156457 RepID=A0A8J8B5G5_9EURY|nr:YIP1 family protein [Methanocalculus chunghsingensis]MBR1369073.1 hypothetical protein [Methanocalculus chunghsingensis]